MPQRLTDESLKSGSLIRTIRCMLYGNCYPVSDRRSGRGPALIVVRLPDGRERAISRLATDFVTESEDPRANRSFLMCLRHICVRDSQHRERLYKT
jgi:hypothetical protein